MRARKKTSSKLTPIWERGYRGYIYWHGMDKLGKVSLAPAPGAAGRYAWEAAGGGGRAETLGQARTAVELAVALAEKQLDLFN